MKKSTRLKKFDKLPDNVKLEVINLRKRGATFEELENHLDEKYGIKISYKSIWNWFKDKQHIFDMALAYGERLEAGELLTASKGLSFGPIGTYQQLLYLLDEISKNPESLTIETHLMLVKDAMNTLSSFMRSVAYTEKVQAELEEKYKKMYEDVITKVENKLKDKPEIKAKILEILKNN